ncbi:MAG: sulfite dehydrogenase, partial [Xanthobacteraceae bacterium]
MSGRMRHGWQKSRRSFLRIGSAAAGAVVLARRAAIAGESSPPAESDWTRAVGPGVVDRTYGQPSKFEKDVIRRNVPWLTATSQSSVSFTPLQSLDGIITPNGLF